MSNRYTSDLEERLEQWGSAETPPPDGAFVNRLDAQLRDLAHAPAAGGERRPFWQPALLTALAVLLVGAGVFAVSRDSGQDVALVMGASSQTEIELPGGDRLAATEGLSLPEGTRISVGLEGSAVINNVVLDPGTEAIVEDGALQVLEARPVVSTTTPPNRPTTTVDRTTTTVQRPTTTVTTAPASSTTAVATTAAPSTAVPTSAVPTSAVPSTADVERSTTVPSPVVSLSWEEVDGNRVLSWTYRGPNTLAGWEVIVSSGNRSQTLAILRDPSVRSITIDALAVPATYTVVARTADGATLVESNPIEIP